LPRRHSSSSLVFTGFVLCAVAAIIAILFGILYLVNALPGFNLGGLVDGILFLVLGLLSLMFSMRVRRRYYATYTVLLLVFSILFLALGLGFGYGLYALLVGILMLLGAIIIMVGRGA
jgi:hypothetical protein